MKLGISFNFFNAEELLLPAILNIRLLCDHISLVYQKISNTGESISINALAVIGIIQKYNLVDKVIEFFPDLALSPSENELNKRKLGLECAVKFGCSHFLLMDADEFYIAEEFQKAKKFIIENNLELTGVTSYCYVKTPIYQMEDTTNVPFIVKLWPSSKLEPNLNYPIGNTDGTRRVFTENRDRSFFFFRNIISCHNFNLVRRSLKSKIKNSSNSRSNSFMNELIENFRNYLGESSFYFPKKGNLPIKITDDIFNISPYLSTIPIHLKESTNRVLLTVNHLTDWAGSEVLNLDLADFFLKEGWSVDIFTNVFSDRIKEYFDWGVFSKKIRILTDPKVISIKEYSLIWSTHNLLPLLDFSSLKDETIGPIIFQNHLSPYLSIEHPLTKIVKSLAGKLIYNSQETKEAILKNYNLNDKEFIVFENAVPSFFSEPDSLKSKRKSELNNILIISNHLVDELKLAIRTLRENYNIIIIGCEDNYEKLQPELIWWSDVIISIGRSVQLGLINQKPVYVYDHFAGPGYLSPDNFNTASFYNFSGRPFYDRKTPEQICFELINGFSKALSFHRNLATDFLEKFKLERYGQIAINDSADIRNRLAQGKLINNSLNDKNYRLNQIFDLNIANTFRGEVELSQTKQELSQTKQELSQTKQELAQTKQKVSQIKQELSQIKQELVARINEIQSIFSSRSWKVTHPLRKFKEFFSVRKKRECRN